MSPATTSIMQTIIRSTSALVGTEQFRLWLKEENPKDGDTVLINNSFIYRKPEIKTVKNEQYLCMPVKDGAPDLQGLKVAKGVDLNSDFKLFRAQSENLPSTEPLDRAITRERKMLGRLVFILIGRLEDASCSVDVKHSLVRKLRFQPSSLPLPSGGESDDTTVVISQLTDPEAAWSQAKTQLKEAGDQDLSSLESAFRSAFEQLQKEARLRLVLPKIGTDTRNHSFISEVRKSVQRQRNLYDKALRGQANGGADAEVELREVMRIAYNFAGDALRLLVLMVSIADLKPLLLWCTAKEHYDLAEAFRRLPWSRGKTKPSLKLYREIISGARNRAFHNLLGFDRTIEVDLEGVSVKARRLVLLPPHRQQATGAQFEYQDREMVDLLSELTRAPEVAAPVEFWRQNARVMEAFENLLAATERALWRLNAASGG